MYKIDKKFHVPTGHRLSKHAGRCKNIHGHNLTVHIGIKSRELNDNDMVMDFSELKALVNESLDLWDHCLLLNKEDEELANVCSDMRLMTFPFDPTAERLSHVLFFSIQQRLPRGIYMDYVTIFENENSKATYTEE